VKQWGMEDDHPPHEGSTSESHTASSAWSHNSLVLQCAGGFVICQVSHTEGLGVYASASLQRDVMSCR